MLNRTYIGHIIEEINKVTEKCGPVLLYGENIDTGSCISGLARGLKVNTEGRILNVGNCELMHIGIGFGMMKDGGNAVVFMKQLDFLLLGLDQIVNTFNSIRAFSSKDRLGSFTIFPIICDQGYQGPQSSLNVASDFASMANVSVFCLNGAEDISNVIQQRFVSPGFRVVCTSQRLFGAPSLDVKTKAQSADNAVFKYLSGDDVSLVCYNFSLRDGLELAGRLSNIGIQSDLFHVNFVPEMDTSLLVQSCARTKKIVIIDDSKTVVKFGDMLISKLHTEDLDFSVLSLGRRGCASRDYGVVKDQFVPDFEAVRRFVGEFDRINS